MRTLVLSFGLLLLGLAGSVFAATPPDVVNFQGVLRDGTGQPLDGEYDMKFSFYENEFGGSLLVSDEHLDGAAGSVPVSGALFNIHLGSGVMVGGPSSLAAIFRDHGEVWMGIQIGDPGEALEQLSPRIRLVSSAYSLNADHLDGVDATQFLRNDTDQLDVLSFSPTIRLQSTQSQTLANSKIEFGSTESGSWQSVGSVGDSGSNDRLSIVGRTGITFNANFSERMRINNVGNVGIGTPNISARLDVVGTTELNGDVTVTGSNNLTVGGTIESTSGGIKFPDGSVQTSAVSQLPPDECFDNVGRYVVCGDGTVKDNLTGLVWLENANCFVVFTDWASANIQAAQLADGQCGLTDGSSPGDWRLPTKAEWQVIVDQAVANACGAPYVPDVVGTGCCGTGTCAFSGLQSSGWDYWSSTTDASIPPDAWYASLNFGGVSTRFKTINFWVWPVRGRP